MVELGLFNENFTSEFFPRKYSSGHKINLYLLDRK